MTTTARLDHVPGYRGLLVDISEATGALCRLHEVTDDFGVERLLETLDLGLTVYEAEGEMFVPMSAFRLYCEMLDRAGEDEDDVVEVAEPRKAAAG